MKGVYGKVLEIDLEHKISTSEEIPDNIYEDLSGRQRTCHVSTVRKRTSPTDRSFFS